MADPRHGFIAFDRAEARGVDDTVFEGVLGDVNDIVHELGVDFLLIGGIGSTALGRERMTNDIDLFVRPDDAITLLQRFDERGFETQRTDPNWIFKAFRDGVIIDIIFKAQGSIFLDDEMIARAQQVTFHGVSLPIAPPEDMIVMKAICADEDSPRHWFDALGLIDASDLDWAYLLHRARKGPRRVASLLLYAQADDLPVPGHALPELLELVYPTATGPAASGAA